MKFLFCCLSALILLTPASGVVKKTLAHELSGNVSLEGTYFFTSAPYTGQRDHGVSLALESEYYHQWANDLSFTFAPFVRLDSADDERSHVDARELYVLYPMESWELRVGVDKVFWGATEFVHLVDIINQTDVVESLDLEEKLGQPMVRFSLLRDIGVFDFFILPYFRERTFPGEQGRLRSAWFLDSDQVLYESAAEEYHVDYALRYGLVPGDADIGLSYFQGTGREPELRPAINAQGDTVLIPYYGQIKQTSMDLSLVRGDWLWKLEALYVSGMSDDHFAGVGGFEITFPALADTNMDLGVIGEYAYDERGEQATSVFQNDVMLGLRLAVNDQAGSEMLLGLSRDLDHRAAIISLEASRRLSNDLKIFVEGIFFADQAVEDAAYGLRDDDYLRVVLKKYF